MSADGGGGGAGDGRLAERRDRLLHEPDPGRALGRPRDHGFPDAAGFLVLARLLGGKADIERRGEVVAFEFERALELRLGGRRDDAAARRHQRLAERGDPLGGRAEHADRVAARLDRFVEALQPHIGGAEHLPTAPIIRIALEMRLDLQDQRRQRRDVIGRDGRASAGEAGRKRLPGQLRGAEREIGCNGAERQRDQRRNGRNPPRAQARAGLRLTGLRRRRRVGAFRRREQPARYLDAGRLGFLWRNRAACEIAIDLRKLVAIDGHVAGGGRWRPPPEQRADDDEHRRSGHQPQSQPKRH